MDKTMILYRGSLKSCNYRCSYCPFSKHRMSGPELEQDRRQWKRFYESFLERAPSMNIRALMVVPYGEALIHPWYWEGMALLSASDQVDAVGAQTNLSFSVSDVLAQVRQAGGILDKLRLWATFHPEMTSIDDFTEKCRRLAEAGISLCAGAVGVPEHLAKLRELRRKLPSQIYLWINQMDGLKRPYTRQEKEDFQEIDLYFLREQIPAHSNPLLCYNRLFVEGNGGVRTCNISPLLKANWYELEHGLPEPECSRKLCSCYLAYGGRQDFMNQILFGPYPLFRIPRRPKAVFLDIDGTLIPDGEASVPAQTAEQLEQLVKAEGTMLFFATSLPFETAIKRCSSVRHLFCGGIFAGGGYLLLTKRDGKERIQKERCYPLPQECEETLKQQKKQFCFQLLTYPQKELPYKLTLIRPRHMLWKKEEAEALFHTLPESVQKGCRYLIEANCLQILSVQASKANGVRTLCRWLKLAPSDTAAAGDSEEDQEMLALCNRQEALAPGRDRER